MTWTPYPVSFRILSPVHIGWRKSGTLRTTRPYIPGKTFWGALTARLVRDEGNNNYNEIGKKVDDELRFTYFYPSIHQDKVEVWPWAHEEDFAWTFLGSYTSTAIEGDTAKEGSLHEVEYILPVTRNGDPVFLVGYIMEKDGCKLKWKDALNRIQIGGERGYGWGRLQLVDQHTVKDCFKHALILGDDNPKIRIPGRSEIFSHAMANDLICKGGVEPIVGRETSRDKGFGGKISEANICWVPGSKVENDTVFIIGKNGIWESQRKSND